jgi:histidinol-phosphatase (PHP family)
MKIDYHIHTEYSYDSRLKADELINKAIILNYNAIAITEHLDLFPFELSRFGLPPFQKYIRHIQNMRDRYASSPLRIIRGVEVGDFQRVKHFAGEFLAQLDLDLKLGAVHFLSDHTNVAVPMNKPLDATAIGDYYRQNLDLVSNCDIHVLAHLGVFKRYYTEAPDENHCQDILKDIFQTMIERDIALEINYSALRKPYGRVLPEPGQIELYRSLGGRLFSIGSDAHALSDFDLGYASLPDWLFDGTVNLISI